MTDLDRPNSEKKAVLNTRKFNTILCVFLISLSVAPFKGMLGNAHASITELIGVRISSDPDRTRLVFDISGPLEYKLYSLDNPDRVVLDLQSARLLGDLPREGVGFVRRVRSAVRNKTDLRIVLDAKKKLKPKTFLLPPSKSAGHRLVVDLYKAPERNAKRQAVKSTQQIAKPTLRDVVIAIDAGHGGKDTGAIGAQGTREKDVVLKIARKLKHKIDKQRGMKGVLVRNSDRYIDLRHRMEIARRAKADLFISIHADAAISRKVRGASVYVLSENGASDEAAHWLANRENKSDLVGGISLDDKDVLIRETLLDLSQNVTQKDSYESAKHVLSAMGNVTRLRNEKILEAGFLVLKSPDIPSILIETAYISNLNEEQNLRSNGYQRKLVLAIVTGLKNYFAGAAPPD